MEPILIRYQLYLHLTYMYPPLLPKPILSITTATQPPETMVANNTTQARSSSPVDSPPSYMRSPSSISSITCCESHRLKLVTHTGKILIFRRIPDFTAPQGISWKSVTPEAITVYKLPMMELQQEALGDLDNHILYCVWKQVRDDKGLKGW